MVESEQVLSLIDELSVMEADRWDEIQAHLWDSGCLLNDEVVAPPPVEGSTDEGGGSEGEDGEGEGTDDDPVKKAYTKLREAESRERATAKKLAQLERQGLSETEQAKAERDEAKAEATALQERLDRIELDSEIRDIAKSMKFRKPEMAKRFITDQKTDKEIRSELKQVLKDFPEMAADGTPPPPVNEGGGNSGSSSNSRMNDVIRKAAGRG